jgi:hypothetical protein
MRQSSGQSGHWWQRANTSTVFRGVETESTGGGGQFLVTSEHRYRRVYTRGTPEYVQARHSGLLERLPALVTAPPGAVEEAENVIGHEFPPLLRRLYVEVGTGDSDRATASSG